MSCRFRQATLLYLVVAAVVVFTIAGGCSPAHYKAEADKEVYKVIDSKWSDNFGEKVNYKISDTPQGPNDLQIPSLTPTVGVLSLAHAVAIATANNRDYQTQKEQLYLIALDLTLERHKYAPQWFTTVDAGYAKDGDQEDVGIASQGTVQQTLLLPGGAIVSAALSIDWLRFLTGDPRTSLHSLLSADLDVPLLGSGGGKIALEQLTQAERNALYQVRAFNRFRQEFVVGVISDYYNVLQRRDIVTNAENDYKRRIEAHDRLEMEAAAGRKQEYEVDQAQQDVLSARDSLVSAQRQYQQQLDEFKITLALPTDANIVLDQNELRAMESIGVSEPDYQVDSAVETALLRRLDLANSADLIDDAVRRLILSEQGLGTQLDLIATADVNSAGKTKFTKLEFDEGSYFAGVSADLPLERYAQRNAYRKALIDLHQTQRSYENAVDTIKRDVRETYRQVIETAQRYGIQKNSVELAQERVESTTMLLQAGRVATRDLLEAQNALVEAQNNLTAALIAHAVAKLSFFRDVGLLQVKPDGMWKY